MQIDEKHEIYVFGYELVEMDMDMKMN